MEQRQLVIILADISGYTRFMLENQTAAVHGQLIITGLIESILRQVDIPLTLQEIEGDAVFLYAAHPGSDAKWQVVLEEVSVKLGRFFEAFLAQAAIGIESTPCGCAICRHADQLGLKIIVHVGTAVFHRIADRPQISGPDVILAHRLLKNGVAESEYLLLTEAAFAAMGEHLPYEFEQREETYEGFGTVPIRVRRMGDDLLAARDALFALDEDHLRAAVAQYTHSLTWRGHWASAVQQLRNPVRTFSLREKLLMLWDGIWLPLEFLFYRRQTIPRELIRRGERRPSSAV